MRGRSIVTVVAVWSCLAWLARGSVPPTFCRGYDCPSFTVLDKFDGVELREYEAATWVATFVNESDFGVARTIGLERLDRYNVGYNDGDHVIPSTTPIIIEIRIDASGYVMSFFTPFKFQASPPTPSSPDVHIVEHPVTQVYVASFGGFAHPDTIRMEAKALLQELQSKGADIDTSKYWFAAYDSPFQITNRHNEIWFERRDAAVPVTTVV